MTQVKYLNYRMEGAYEFLRADCPNDLALVDFFGPMPTSTGGVKYLFVVQDVFSKHVKIYPIKRATMQICIKKLQENYFCTIGKPCRVLPDHGTQFTSPCWKRQLEAEGVLALFFIQDTHSQTP